MIEPDNKTPSPQKQPKKKKGGSADNSPKSQTSSADKNKKLHHDLKRKAKYNQPQTTRVSNTGGRSKKPSKFNFMFEGIKEEDEKTEDIEVDLKHI